MFSNCGALALVFFWLGVPAHVCHQNPTHASRLLLYFFFSSRGGKWPNIPSFVLRHFAFMPVQHCLVVSSLHPCLPASLHAIFLWPCPVTVSGGVISCLSEDHLLISFLVPLILIVTSPEDDGSYTSEHLRFTEAVISWRGTFWGFTPPHTLKAWPGHSEQDPEQPTHREG